MSTKRVRLTDSERMAVDNFIAAARALPKGITIYVDEMAEPGEPTLKVFKAISDGCAERVASLRKKSLLF